MALSVFTNTCAYCKKRLSRNSNIFCIECIGDLPKTYFCLSQNNIVTERFKGLLKKNFAGSYLYYQENGMVKQLLWEIKYNQNTLLAEELGRISVLDNISLFKDNFDLIIPIPLHKNKLLLRGYNQTEFLAKGMSEETKLPFSSSILYRAKETTTQTKLNRIGRFENVSNAFEIKNKEKIEGKRILLIDDVITTGATLEAAGLALLQHSISSLNIYTFACALEI